MSAAHTAPITRDDLQARLQALADSLNAASAPARRSGFRVSVIGGAALVVLAFFLGRRRGRLTRTFVELRRY
ncbi:MAG: hypothetical protein OXH20_08795 [bacterium]|nr:hypothetical protein [bacterium]MXZ29347.1 hypothetical protein [Acidimicrobiia bacterium]MDE0669911.1 hypothetical protein [bacterium]MYB25280.1 hypothetical protein [Acidimicrobiia bacterium]MYE67339.1 hypothetical protein [Acidimicrobiia bacterium]